jgi:hypothetical protein
MLCRIDVLISKDFIMRRCLIAFHSFFIAIHCALAYAQEIVYFICADRYEQKYFNDSFVLPISKPEDVREARRLLKEAPPTTQRIALANINRRELRKIQGCWHGCVYTAWDCRGTEAAF